jgi:acetyl-CoA C-acetyltransferase
MPLNNKTAVIGSAIRAPVIGDRQSLEELLYEVAQAALKDAGIAMDDIDGIVVGSNDQFDGRAISVMAASGSVGGVDRDILSTPSAGEHAFVMGVLRVASGQYKTHLVVSWSPTEAHSLSEAERLAADPYFHRRLPLDDNATFALQASALAAVQPDVHATARAMTAKSIKGGGAAATGDKRGRWPLTADMMLPPVTGAVALVLASEAFVKERRPSGAAWVRGMGWATETGFLGDRDLASAPALDAATKRAYEEAGMSSPADSLDVAEITGPTPYQELLVLEGLGLSRRDQWAQDVASGAFGTAGKPPVNPSGGARAANAVYCNGLIRIAEAARQILGRAGPHQVRGAKVALAHAASGAAMQYQTVVILGHDR